MPWHWNNTALHEEGFLTQVSQERSGHASATTNLGHSTHVRDSVLRQAAEPVGRMREAAPRNLQLANGGTPEEIVV